MQYQYLWPDLSEWPSAAWVRWFCATTKRSPQARLAILTGLRRFASVELGTFWAGIATYIAVIVSLITAASAVQVALPVGWSWAAWLPSTAVSVAFAIFVFKLMTLSAEADERRRSSAAWLSAIEDGLR